MNNDQIKEALLSIEDAPLDFSVVLSGKKSKKVNGLYKPEGREIIIHSKNFDNDNAMLYTAIHESAHHLDACAQGGKISGRAHTTRFRAILHSLLEKAEAKGVYSSVYAASPELLALTGEIREKYLKADGELLKELGEKLLKAEELCKAAGGRFEDYVERVLCIPRLSADTAIRMYRYGLNPSTGPDNMRYLAGIRNDEDRSAAEAALLSGKSPDTVKAVIRKGEESALPVRPPTEEDTRERLEKEKDRLERTIQSLTKRLHDVETQLEEI
jgi:hypothetical protein